MPSTGSWGSIPICPIRAPSEPSTGRREPRADRALYDVERAIRGKPPDERRRLRQARSQPTSPAAPNSHAFRYIIVGGWGLRTEREAGTIGGVHGRITAG